MFDNISFSCYLSGSRRGGERKGEGASLYLRP